MGFRYVASGPMVRSSYKAGELFMEAMMDEDEEKSNLASQLGIADRNGRGFDWQSRERLSKHAIFALEGGLPVSAPKAPLR